MRLGGKTCSVLLPERFACAFTFGPRETDVSRVLSTRSPHSLRERLRVFSFGGPNVRSPARIKQRYAIVAPIEGIFSIAHRVVGVNEEKVMDGIGIQDWGTGNREQE